MKRFTETAKWDDAWFGELPPMAKLLWYFLCDNCDHAGVWEVNARLADFKIGAPMPWNECHTWFGDRVRVLPGGKWLLPKYTRFQNPHGLNPRDKFTGHVIARLKHHGLTLADIGLDRNESGPVDADSSAVSPPPPAQKESASGGSPEGASKGDGRGIQPLQRKRQEHDSVLNMSRSRSHVLDGGSRGEGSAEHAAPPGNPPKRTQGEVLAAALERNGLDSSPKATREWGRLLMGRGKCGDFTTGIVALDWIMERSKRDGILVRYAKHADQLADAWAANQNKPRVVA